MKTLSDEETRLWHAWKLAGEAVMARLAQDLAEEAELSGPDFGVLSRLVELGSGSLRQQELADSMRWDKSRLSHQLTRMEGRGLVRRQPGESRGVVVSITAAGRQAIDTARPVHARSLRRHLLSRLDREEFETLRTICERLADLPATPP
jgi:DNA-binding MarR family transcriptional regulator